MEIENNRIATLVTHNCGQPAPVDNRSSGSEKAASEQSGSTSDRISLTGDAQKLKGLESELASQPVVDTQRVNAVRAAVEDGTFTVNPERIAEKMISLEQALTDAR